MANFFAQRAFDITAMDVSGLTGAHDWAFEPDANATVHNKFYQDILWFEEFDGTGAGWATGFGGTDAIQDEFHPSLAFDKPYLLAMANAGPGTGSSQFFITTKTQRLPEYLNGKHPIFGIVVEGQEVSLDLAPR